MKYVKEIAWIVAFTFIGEVEGAMSSLSICVAGILTVILVPLVSGMMN